MPSVEMRRSTRVFGARVLRFGRRLSNGPGEVKRMRAGGNTKEWINLLGSSDVDVRRQCKVNGWHGEGGLNQEPADHMDVDESKLAETRTVQSEILSNSGLKERKWGNVYSRKRKIMGCKSSNYPDNSKEISIDRMYGKKFVRRHKRKRSREDNFVGHSVLVDSVISRGFIALVESACGQESWFSCFLHLILRYLRRARVKMQLLSAFLLSDPIAHVYSSHGIQFVVDWTPTKSSGFCKILGSRNSTPFFTVNFSAIPSCFVHLHLALLLKSAFLDNVLLLLHSVAADLGDTSITDEEELQLGIPCETSDQSLRSVLAGSGKSRKRKVTFLLPKMNTRSSQLKNGVTTRSMQKSSLGMQKRSSLRSKRRRSSSRFVVRKVNRNRTTDLFSKQDGVPFFPIKSDPELISSVRKNSSANIKELKSTLVGLTKDIDSKTCSANILVIESDKCYREEGAVISLELSSSSQNVFLLVKKNGISRFSITAEKVMKPCSTNRITHAIVWPADNEWKLEFPNRQDWFIFKELYRRSSELNLQAPSLSMIPVPGVREVSGYENENRIPFGLPDAYLSVKDDELARAFERGGPVYDMDSEDGEWLTKFNSESCMDNGSDKNVSEDRFELVIDAFEKGFFLGADDYSDAKAAVDHCAHLGTREFLEAVYHYWMAKRKKKRTALIRIFQLYQPRKSELLPKSILRKKRSCKRQASQKRRGKQLAFLKAVTEMPEKQGAVAEQNAVLKVQEARTAQKRSEEIAILKRQRAELLMEIADLATYKATMALRLAEAAAATDALDADRCHPLHFLSLD